VTNKEDGGWWEGTSHETGKTGWFPSNYVKEVDDVISGPTKVETAQEILAKQVTIFGSIILMIRWKKIKTYVKVNLGKNIIVYPRTTWN
jgi:hypothetical protein